MNRSIDWGWYIDGPPPSLDAVNLINSLLETNPEDRLGSRGAKEIKEQPVFHDIEWTKLCESQLVNVPRTENIEDTSYFDSRGLTLKDLEQELLEVSKAQSAQSALGLELSPGRPSHRRTRSGSPHRGSPGIVGFDDFNFKNPDHLRQQK